MGHSIIPNATESQALGFTRQDFEVSGRPGLVILPHTHADGNPWVFYAPILQHHLPDCLDQHDWLFRSLLEKGFAIGGVDVGESYGNPQGRAVFSDFHRTVVNAFALSTKVCLLPQSRGGLMLYNWATEHPDWLRCIGGIYTVCDLRSYPGLETACQAYGMTASQLSADLENHNPVDRLDPLARASIPIFHVHGDVDEVVPLAENAGALAQRYEALGGNVQLVTIRGKGHEVCKEFMQCPELLAFFVTQAIG